MKQDLMQPDPQSEVHDKYRHQALVCLTADITNKDLLSVVMVAADMGAVEFLEQILHIKNVYVLKDGKNGIIDVTNLTHGTMKNASQATRTKKLSVSKRKTQPLDMNYGKQQSQEELNKSCLDLIVACPNLHKANQMLDIVPIKQIVRNYWSVYQWIYGILMVVHVTFMSLFSAYGIPLIKETNDTKIWPYITFLLWPIMLLIFEGYYMVASVLHFCRTKSKSSDKTRKMWISSSVKGIIGISWKHLSHITSCIFSTLVIVWFILYYTKNSYQAHILAIVMVFGWLYTIVFTDGFETVHAFTIMLKKIIIRDMTRFIFLYCLVLFAFSLAFQCLFSIAERVEDNFPTEWSTFFVSFNMMIGMDTIFYESFDDDYAAAGREHSATFVKLLYLVYILLTTVILLNLLIAMMTDSYSAVTATEGTTWRVGSVQLAIEIEKNMPFLPKFFKLIGVKQNPEYYDEEKQRWMMSIPRQEVSLKNTAGKKNAFEAIRSLEKEIRDMKNQQDDMNDRIQMLMERSYEQNSSSRPGTAMQNTRVVSAFPKGGLAKRRHSTIHHRPSNLGTVRQNTLLM